MAPPKNFEDFTLPRSSFFIRIRDSRILPPSSPPSPPLYFRNYTFPPAENNDNTTKIVRPEDHETSCQFALTLSPTTMYPASRTSARSTSRYSFAMDYDINIAVTNDDDPFTDLNIPESRETNIPRLFQHNNGNERALYAPLSAMNSDENSRISPRSLFNQFSTITNPARSERNNEPRTTERRQNYMHESQISWLGQHPYALTSFQQHYEQDDKPDLSQENSNVMLTKSETSQSVHYKEFTPDLFLFSIFDAIMKYLNAEYALRSSLKNSRYVVLLRVPILKRSFGGFKGTYVLAKELVAEMALEELIKQMPHVVYIVLKSKGLDDVLDVVSQKQIRPLYKEYCREDDVEIEKLDENSLETYCPIENLGECPIENLGECPIENLGECLIENLGECPIGSSEERCPYSEGRSSTSQHSKEKNSTSQYSEEKSSMSQYSEEKCSSKSEYSDSEICTESENEDDNDFSI
ncbi:2422_t:CDS:2 [Racocetra persica]|uniref:2422_t:CDS:1 n=1 Tax=Racocetra persica TaxID=160502 RepID=A0ACA9RIP2_9GLOM|nr:2422_t:CDS:2 [Racocetra persica]